jgi:xanthine dehydrogenase small subunit
MNSKPIRFLKAGRVQTLHDVAPTRTLLEVLREDMHCTGTKEGCGEGDCGACTVVIGENVGGKLQTRAINSCIRMAHSVDGMALWTVEDLSSPQGAPHPVQQAMVQCHASQCGFCTPGFVMSLFALYELHKGQSISREQAQGALSGNLCRCTGYRPILDAAVAMQALPPQMLDTANVLAQLQALQESAKASTSADPAYLSPTTLKQLLHAKSKHPTAQLVAGCTDVGLWVTKMHMQFERVIDTTQVAKLRRLEDYPHHIAIGAAVPLTDAFAALVADRPQLASFAHRFAGLPVRNSGTLGGNVANGSPIGDSMPLLIALGANIVLMREHKGKVTHREMPLEQLYTGYRKNVMAPDEVLAWIKVPKALPGEFMRVYKISKRFEDDISAVCLAIHLQLADGVVSKASIGVGGVAATTVRAVKTQAALTGKAWNTATVNAAAAALQSEFSPISDMRATADYRSTVLGNLLQRFWMESQGLQGASLEDIAIVEDHTRATSGAAA